MTHLKIRPPSKELLIEVYNYRSKKVRLPVGKNRMNSFAKKQNEEFHFRATGVFFTEDSLCVQLSDGREVRVPLEFYPKLKKATQLERENFEIIGLGIGIHWPSLNEDLSTRGIVLGIPAL